MLLLYVDDMLIPARDKSKIMKLKKLLSTEFEMKDLGSSKKILGMEIRRDRKCNRLFLSQHKYIKKVLHHFGMEGAKSKRKPIIFHFKLLADLFRKTEEDAAYMSYVPYSSAVGSLMYAMICTYPNIAHAVSVVSCYMSNPGKEHCLAVKSILWYLKGTTGLSLNFGRCCSKLMGFVDLDYAGDLDKKRSMTEYMFIVGGMAISWKATLQRTVVALSTTEPEYMVATEDVKEALWLKGLFEVFCLGQKSVTMFVIIRVPFIRNIILKGRFW